MILRDDYIERRPVFDRLFLRARLRLQLILSEVAVGSIEMTRIGLVTVAMALQTLVLLSPGHFRPAPNLLFAVFVPVGTFLSLALCLVTALPVERFMTLGIRRLVGIVAIALLGLLTVTGISRASGGVNSVLAGHPYTNDGAAMDLYAAGQVVRGHNPYVKTNIVAALAAIDAPAITTTPLMRGQFRGLKAYPSDTAISNAFMNVLRLQPRTIPPEFESKYNYPSGSFVFILPFVWAGIHDMRFLYALALVAIGWYLARKMPLALRPLVPLILLADVPLMALTAGGQPDPIYGLFLLIGFAEWRSRHLSPIFMGLAIATKQLAWFFLPFYLLLIVRKYGWREGLRRSGVMIALFLVLNGPFILQSPGAYIGSIAGPMTDPMFPLGIGIVALFVSNVLPMLPKYAFTIAEVTAWAAGLFTAARVRTLAPAGAAALAALPLFFAYRSLVNYFYLVPLLALGIMLAESTYGRRQESLR